MLCDSIFVDSAAFSLPPPLHAPLMNANDAYGVLSKMAPLALQGFARD